MSRKYILLLVIVLMFSACVNSNNDNEVPSADKEIKYIIPFNEKVIASFFQTLNNYSYSFLYNNSNKEWYFSGQYVDSVNTGYRVYEENITNYKIEDGLFYILENNEYVLGNNLFLDLNVSYLSPNYYKEILENSKILKMNNNNYYIENYNYTFNIENNVLNIYIDTNYGAYYFISFKKL